MCGELSRSLLQLQNWPVRTEPVFSSHGYWWAPWGAEGCRPGQVFNGTRQCSLGPRGTWGDPPPEQELPGLVKVCWWSPAPKRRQVPTVLLTKHVGVSIARPLREGRLLVGTATLGLLLCNSSSLVGIGPGALWYPTWTFLMCHTYLLWWCLLVWIKMKEALVAILLSVTHGS